MEPSGSPYRVAAEPASTPDISYVRAWRNRRIIGVLAVASVVATTAAVIVGASWIVHAACVACATVFANWYYLYRCPRCGEALGHSGGVVWRPIRKACVHCGLRLGATSPPTE